MNKRTWISPQLTSLSQNLIKTAATPTQVYAEFYTQIMCVTLTGQAAANSAAMAACSMNGVSGDSFTYNATCSVTAVGPNTWAPGTTAFNSTFGNNCCPGANPFGGMGAPAAGATFAVSAMVACS